MKRELAGAGASDRLAFLRGVLLGGVSALALGVSPAVAQEDIDGGDEETIVVTGIRGSLQRSMEIKRNAVGVVDAISAEDIGKFPDSNLATAIQRIPGISVSRGDTSIEGVPTTTGDATQVTVRGFGPAFNQTLFDGRLVPSGTVGRGFDFSSLGADFVQRVDILKTPDPSLSSGAIGATINIYYPKPLDQPGFRLAGSASVTHAPNQGDYTPSGGFLISNTFADDSFGVLLSLATSNRQTLGTHINNQGWVGTFLNEDQYAVAPANAAGTPVWFSQSWGAYQEETEDERVDGRLVLQWSPSDELTLTANQNYSKDEIVQAQYGYSVWFNGGNLTEVELNEHGTVSNFIQPNTPTDFHSQINGSVIENSETGLNVRWDQSDNLSFDFDVSRAVARLNPDGQISSIDMDVGYGPSGPGGANGTDVGLVIGGRDNLPVLNAYGPGGDASRALDVSLIGSHVLPITVNQTENSTDQFKVQGIWSDDALAVRVGVHWLRNQFSNRSASSFVNNNWQAYSGYGPNSNNAGGVDLPDTFFTPFTIGPDFIDGWGAPSGASLPPGFVAYNPYEVIAYLESLGDPRPPVPTVPPTTTIPGANPTVDYDGVYRFAEDVGAHRDLEEETTALFLSVSNESQIAGMALRISAGARYEQTTVTSTAIGRLPTLIEVQASDLTALEVTFTEPGEVTGGHEYRFLLPNVDVNLELTDTLKLRADFARTLTRAPLNRLTPTLTVDATPRVGALTANGNNPALMPFLADNIDIGLEWYYADNSYLSAGAFIKEVSNFIVGGTTTQNINNVVDPTTGQLAEFSVTTFVNGESAQVTGLEFAVQHVFSDSGFGIQANATFVDTDKPYDETDISQTGFAVTGLANSANLVGFYENYGFHARIALNWRDEYLDAFGQRQNTSSFGAEPTFVNASTLVDFSTSYDFNEHLSVFFEGLNLTGETYSTHGRFDEQILDVIDTGSRYTVGVRGRF